MNKLNKQQRGTTLIGWVIIIGLIAFFVTIILKVGPLYLEDYKIKSVLASFEDEQGLREKSKRDIKKMLWSKFYTNSIEIVDVERASKDVVNVVKRDGKLAIDINYTTKVHLFGNLSVEADFSHHFDVIFH
jgi:hypothetical protein